MITTSNEYLNKNYSIPLAHDEIKLFLSNNETNNKTIKKSISKKIEKDIDSDYKGEKVKITKVKRNKSTMNKWLSNLSNFI